VTRKTSGRAETRKSFTLIEATRALPLVRAIVKDVVDRYSQIRELVERINGQPGRVELQDRLEELKDELMANVDELHQLGVELKSFEMGLVDFYSERAGQGIYLCWKLGEEKISWWHTLEDGYSGRLPILP
jgi:hypothetical protein